MYDNQLYASGVYGALIVEWRLRCETPLVVRNGVKFTFRTQNQTKTRGQGTQFHWRKKNSNDIQDYEVAALHYGYLIQNNQISTIHAVPPSSVRGSLRSWTINHLVQPAYREGMTPPDQSNLVETEKYVKAVNTALETDRSGYHWIASLFGMAFDARDEGDDHSNAGRLRVETLPFTHSTPQRVDVNGNPAQVELTPGQNAHRQLTVRNPLDRVTHASRDGGLHQFLEFCRGEEFQVRLTILNPRETDLGVVSLWRREMETGLLRLGALSSIGRGRVSFAQESYQVWLGPGAPTISALRGAPKDPNAFPDDALAGLWDAYSLPKEKFQSDVFLPAVARTYEDALAAI